MNPFTNPDQHPHRTCQALNPEDPEKGQAVWRNFDRMLWSRLLGLGSTAYLYPWQTLHGMSQHPSLISDCPHSYGTFLPQTPERIIITTTTILLIIILLLWLLSWSVFILWLVWTWLVLVLLVSVFWPMYYRSLGPRTQNPPRTRTPRPIGSCILGLGCSVYGLGLCRVTSCCFRLCGC